MKLNLTENGSIISLENNDFTVPFYPDRFGFEYLYDDKLVKVPLLKTSNGYEGEKFLIKYKLNYEIFESYVKLNLSVENISNYDFFAKDIRFNLAVDSYMEKYPDWRYKYFPTLMRLEKTHFYGYYLSPNGSALAVASEKPIPYYDVSYAHPDTPHLNNGHRVYNSSITIIGKNDKVARLNACKSILKAGETFNTALYFIPLNSTINFESVVSKTANIPIISAEKYTFEIGDNFDFNVTYSGNYSFSLKTPNGKIYNNEKPILTEYGEHTLTVTADNGKISESLFFVRKPWDFYLYGASKEALNKQQKATTHTESWYGYFSLFLAQKYFKDDELFNLAKLSFDEVMPLCFSFTEGKPILAPIRIQNTALFISLLVDLYETNPTKNLKYLSLASLYGDYLIENQTDDGVYRRGKIHYTSVIYVAKSMLELVKAEKSSNDENLNNKANIHYQSAKRAIDELVLHLDNIDTEGELTFEDGMISCSALQIGFFALTLPENERAPYIEASEKLIEMHSCLEQKHNPDCRVNSCSLRFWESQYDVMIRGNSFNSPHGWSAWTQYAFYYLYMLTGKKKYLVNLMNGISACCQLLDLNGNLRWGFFSQPYVKLKTLVPDTTKPVKDGYKYFTATETAYQGKYEEKEYGESYIDMVSSWFRIGENKVAGGYAFCPLILSDGYRFTDNQGGSCDNDVHEIFKCLEETVFRKAFIYENDDGSYLTYGVKVNGNDLVLNDNETTLVYNLKTEKRFTLNGNELVLNGFNQINV